MAVQFIRMVRDRQPSVAAVPRIAEQILMYKPRWISSPAHSTLSQSGNLRNLARPGEVALSQDVNNTLLPSMTRHGLCGKNSALSGYQYMTYPSAVGLLDGATELTLFVSFVFSSSDLSAQQLSFRTEANHTLDIFSQTSSSVTWGADWAGAWNGASQQTLSNLVSGDRVTLVAVIRQDGARFFHNGVFAGTKAGSGFTVSTSANVTYIESGFVPSLLLNGAFFKAMPDGLALEISRNPWQVFAPETIPLFFSTVTAQYARPTSDVSAGTWTASSGSDLFAMLDETVADDGDYITTTTASTCEVALGSLTDPAVSTGHIVRYRISATGGGIIVRLREGTTTIASWTHDPAPASLTTYAQTLSAGEADAITDYSALRLQFEATA